jgi:hypothetical protein
MALFMLVLNLLECLQHLPSVQESYFLTNADKLIVQDLFLNQLLQKLKYSNRLLTDTKDCSTNNGITMHYHELQSGVTSLRPAHFCEQERKEIKMGTSLEILRTTNKVHNPSDSD